jgi:hypothetical protein
VAFTPSNLELGVTDVRSASLDVNVTSYVNPGGETFTPDMFGFKRLIGATVTIGVRGFVYNFVKSGVNLKLTIAQDNGTATAAALPEIPNGNAHGAITVLAIGR